jgi:hypothetical protein
LILPELSLPRLRSPGDFNSKPSLPDNVKRRCIYFPSPML